MNYPLNSMLEIEIQDNGENTFTYYTKEGICEHYLAVAKQANLIDYIKMVREAGNFTPLSKIVIKGKNNSDYIKTLIPEAQEFGKENNISIELEIINTETII